MGTGGPGKVWPEFYANCGRCGVECPTMAPSEIRARSVLLAAGWRQTRSVGWCCGDCLKERAAAKEGRAARLAASGVVPEVGQVPEVVRLPEAGQVPEAAPLPEAGDVPAIEPSGGGAVRVLAARRRPPVNQAW